jgi:hypothetical protein
MTFFVQAVGFTGDVSVSPVLRDLPQTRVESNNRTLELSFRDPPFCFLSYTHVYIVQSAATLVLRLGAAVSARAVISFDSLKRKTGTYLLCIPVIVILIRTIGRLDSSRY